MFLLNRPSSCIEAHFLCQAGQRQLVHCSGLPLGPAHVMGTCPRHCILDVLGTSDVPVLACRACSVRRGSSRDTQCFSHGGSVVGGLWGAGEVVSSTCRGPGVALPLPLRPVGLG